MPNANESTTSAAAAGIVFVAPDGKALFLRRGPGGDHPGEWCFPGGGLEAGETAEDAAKREALEEIGALPYGERAAFDESDNGEGKTYTTFRQHIAHPFTPRLNPEHTAHEWAPLEAPPQPLHPGVQALMLRLQQ